MYVEPAFGPDVSQWKHLSPQHQMLQRPKRIESNGGSRDFPLETKSQQGFIDHPGESPRPGCSQTLEHNDIKGTVVINTIELPKFLLLNATWDFSLLNQAREFHTCLAAAGVDVESHLIPNTDHFTIVGQFQHQKGDSEVREEEKEYYRDNPTFIVGKFVSDCCDTK